MAPALPAPMLARGGDLPRGRYGYEVKWDGFRAIVATGAAFRVRSRRGWDMTTLVPELRDMRDGLVLDGELVALDADGHPDEPRLCRRILHGETIIPIVYLIFDVLTIDGDDVKGCRYSERRELLDELELRGPHWHTPPYGIDGEHLHRWTLEHGLEGVVAKRLDGRYRPGRRDWIKIKHRSYWRFEHELESVRRHLERRTRRASVVNHASAGARVARGDVSR